MVPRKIGHIWIGPHPAPTEWMDTWKAAHPDWDYTLFDNAYLTGRRFRNQALINEYFRRGKYAGVSDLMRYEMLYEQGGFLPEADSICLHPVDGLFTQARAYSVYEFPEGRTGMMSPFLASAPGNRAIGAIIDSLATLKPEDMDNPWTTTGNGFLRHFFNANPRFWSEVTVFPSHYFIPEHFKGEVYSGTDTIYARQLWGSTLKAYPHDKERGPVTADQIASSRAEVSARLADNLRDQMEEEARLAPHRRAAQKTRNDAEVQHDRRDGTKILFCGAHPDDAEIYAFGTLFAYRKAHAEVVLLTATNGENGSRDRSLDRPLSQTRHEEAEKSAALLGARLIALSLPDAGLSANFLKLALRLGSVFQAEKPSLIITHSAHDYHADHRSLSAAVTLAARDLFPVIFADTMKGANFRPTHFVEIGAFQEKKFECLRLHHSQKPRRYVLAAKELAARRGRQATGNDSRHMEAFHVDADPRFPDALALLPPGAFAAR